MVLETVTFPLDKRAARIKNAVYVTARTPENAKGNRAKKFMRT